MRNYTLILLIKYGEECCSAFLLTRVQGASAKDNITVECIVEQRELLLLSNSNSLKCCLI